MNSNSWSSVCFRKGERNRKGRKPTLNPAQTPRSGPATNATARSPAQPSSSPAADRAGPRVSVSAPSPASSSRPDATTPLGRQPHDAHPAPVSGPLESVNSQPVRVARVALPVSLTRRARCQLFPLPPPVFLAGLSAPPAPRLAAPWAIPDLVGPLASPRTPSGSFSRARIIPNRGTRSDFPARQPPLRSTRCASRARMPRLAGFPPLTPPRTPLHDQSTPQPPLHHGRPPEHQRHCSVPLRRTPHVAPPQVRSVSISSSPVLLRLP